MTEAEWRACADPKPMLAFLRGKTSERKLRLFGCACVRRIAHLLVARESKEAVEVAERYAEGGSLLPELRSVGEAADDLWVAGAMGDDARFDDAGTDAAEAAASVTHPDDALEAARMAAEAAANAMSYRGRQSSEKQAQADLLREIVGPPFRQVSVNSSWLAWNDATVPKLAQGIYEERAFDRMPILADALEEAGCTDTDILAHCRRPGEHVRGCWVVDLLLGKD